NCGESCSGCAQAIDERRRRRSPVLQKTPRSAVWEYNSFNISTKKSATADSGGLFAEENAYSQTRCRTSIVFPVRASVGYLIGRIEVHVKPDFEIPIRQQPGHLSRDPESSLDVAKKIPQKTSPA